ncbi:MAG: gliding motility-associated C-terminal domain-containing protein, partial [Bacteroidia bacterium]|nr:gliding motility-associated C-terminal domain-containing protein [Bacteroidia bacterium]
MSVKTLCALLAGLLGCLPQLSAQKDTEFWFAVPEVSSDHGDQPIRLRVSAFDQSAIVRVTLPADPSFQPLVALLQPNQASTIELSNFKEVLENKPPDMVHNKGLLIESTSPITAYYDVSSTNNPELFLLKGANALGKRFYIPSQFALNNQIGYESFDIVATRDSTRITITPSQFAVGRAAGQPFTIVLNRGQTFSVRAGTQSAGGHLRGSYIESDKPIAVTSSDDSIRFGNGWDLVGDQLVPVELTGTEYIAVPGYFNSERIFITATEPNTQIFVNNGPSPAATLGAGQSHQIALSTQAMFIRATAPVYVLHLSGIGDEAGSALLPPLNCTGAEQVGFIRGFGTNNLIVLTQAGNEGSFILNGSASAIPAAAFQPVPGTSGEWVAARVDANPILSATGTNLLRNTTGLFHLGVLNTSGSGAAYGYFSQFNSLYFGGEITVCRGDTAVLDAGADRQSILWNTGSTERYLRVTEPGIYWATVTFRTCTATDTVLVSVVDVPLELGPDTSFCANKQLALVAGPDIGRYIWNGSVEDRFLIVDEPGLYRVSLTRDGCTVYDSIGVAALPVPQPDLGPDTALCRWQDYQLNAALPGASYRWQDGSTGPQLRVQEAGLYHVEVTSADGCVGRDSMINRPVFESLDLGRDTLLCLGESLRFDLSFPGTSYLWQDGSTEPRYEIREAGLYHVQVDNGCQTFRDSVTADYADCSAAVHLASAFTPNGDGVNETFGPAYNGQITEFEFRIFNRWGQEVFASGSPDAAWDGRFQGVACPAGVYVWRMSYHSIHQRRLRKVFTQGTVTLLR